MTRCLQLMERLEGIQQRTVAKNKSLHSVMAYPNNYIPYHYDGAKAQLCPTLWH